MIMPPAVSARARASADLPLAVGPAISARGGRSLMFIATLIAKERLTGGDISAAVDALAAVGVHVLGHSWVEADVACDLLFPLGPGKARAALEGLILGVDLVVQAEAG